MKTIKYLLILSALVYAACADKWDEHYGLNSSDKEASVVSPLNLLEYLKTQPQYSKFVEELEKTNVAEELTRDQYLTVWVVNDDAMSEFDSIKSIQYSTFSLTDTFLAKFHINNLTFGVDKFKDGVRLKSLNGKYIAISKTENGTFNIDRSALVKGNQFCKNGVVHEISRLMVPKESIYEYLQGLGNDYSTIRDTIFALNKEVFDPVNSIPTGVNGSGNTEYDSVFVIQNPFFEYIDFRSEFIQATMFLPSNTIIDECLSNLKAVYVKLNRTFTIDDTLMAVKWIKESLFYNSTLTNYGSETVYKSVYNKTWNTLIQRVDMNSVSLSNGLIYKTAFLEIPKNVYLTRMKGLFHYYEHITDSTQKAELFTVSNAVEVSPRTADSYSFPTIGVSGNYRILYLKGADPADGNKLAIEFTGLDLVQNTDGSYSALPYLVDGGEYNLYMGVQSKNHAYINVYFNGKLIKKDLDVTPATPWNYDRNNQTVPGTKWDGLGGLVGIVKIPGQTLSTFKIKIEFSRLSTGTVEEMKLYHWALVPVAN
jgi:uncharacterized surface protein with fasciclin (FAS1) repeats